MPTYGPGSLPPAYTWVDGDTAAEVDGGTGVNLGEFIEIDRQEIRALWNKLGLTPAGTDSMGYVLIGDGVDKGLYVPIAALGEPNLLVNGNLEHAQQMVATTQTSTTTYSTTTSYCLDQWFVLPAGASVTQARSTSVPDTKSRFSLAVTGASSVTTVDIGQRIEAAYAARYKTTLLFRAYVHNVTGASFTPNLRIGTPGAADDFTTVTNRLNQALQSCADNAWTEVYHVFDPSAYTNVDNGIEVCLRVPSGSLVAGDVVRIAQASLWPSTQRMPFVVPDPVFELIRSQRFYQKSFAQGTAVAQNSGTTAGALSTRVTVGGTGGVSTVAQPFPVVMRTAPTMTSYNPVAANANWRDATAGIDCSGTNGFSQVGDRGFEAWTLQVAGNLQTDLVYVHYTANARL